MFRPHRNNVLMLNLTAFSLLFLLILAGLFQYSSRRTLVPATQGAGMHEAVLMWTVWAIVVAVPVLTGALWIMRLPRVVKAKPEKPE